LSVLRSQLSLSRRAYAAAVAVLLLIGSAFLGAKPVTAGTYTVSQCDYQLAISSNAFVWQASGVPAPTQHANSGCLEFGLAVRSSGLGTAQVYPGSARGGYVVTAPPGTAFTRFAGAFGTLSNCCIAGMEAYADAEEFSNGSGSRDEIFRGPLGPSTWQVPSGSQGPVPVVWSAEAAGFSAEQIGYFLACGDVSGCAQSPSGDLRIRGRSFEFTLDDLVAPEILDVGGDLVSEGWLRGTRSLEISAADQGGGLAGVSAFVDGVPLVSVPYGCSKVADRFVNLQPCPLSQSGTWNVDTRDIEDGVSALEVAATDVGRAAAEESVTLKVDNTPPAAPLDLAVDGTQGWRPSRDFDVGWTEVEEEHAPLARTHFEICPVPDGDCVVGVREGDSDGALDVDVPNPGTYSLRVWFDDTAGNTDPSGSSTSLRFDDSVPGKASVDAPERWLGRSQDEAVSIPIHVVGTATDPPSGVAGFAVTSDGSTPDESVDLAGAVATYEAVGLSEGQTPISARAISGSGVAATSVGAAIVKIDRSSPIVMLDGVPGSGWRTEPVSGWISSVDQVGLSGVNPAPDDRPIDAGGYLVVRLDDRAARSIRGNLASVTTGEDGHHTLTYRAFDAAGNASVQKEIAFKIDKTDPVGSFRALDPADPRELRVDVMDATSGIAGGWIEYRKAGESGFRRLETRRSDGVLAARLDDRNLPAGRYEVRAVVIDVAGNEAIIGTWADGAPAVLGMPLRLSASLSAMGEVTVKRCAKAPKGRRGKGKRGKARPRSKCRREAVSKATLELAHGKRAASSGRLTTGQGVAIAGAPIVVEAQARTGGAFVHLGVTRTDAQGLFRFKIPSGPSRTVRYRYDGTNTVKPAEGRLTTKVRAAARLKVSRRRLLNGQAVRFTGRLLGKPIPAGGKLVALQARVGREWRTFATPRANAKGLFKHRYRFTATTGLRRYAFRAVVAREAAYPYEAGRSRTVRVAVRGR
jgi:hypothetical protein